MRLKDQQTTLYNTGNEGEEWANRLAGMSDAKFNLCCDIEFTQPENNLSYFPDLKTLRARK